MLRLVAPGIKQPPTIIIPDHRRRPGSAQYEQRIQHPLHRLVELHGNDNSIESSQNPGMEKKIQRVDVVISGLLKIKSVLPHLCGGLAFQDLPTLLSPSRCTPPARK